MNHRRPALPRARHGRRATIDRPLGAARPRRARASMTVAAGGLGPAGPAVALAPWRATAGMLLRLALVLAGAWASVLPFCVPLGMAAALYAVAGAFTGPSPGALVALLWRAPWGPLVWCAGAAWLLYWPLLGWLAQRFVRGRPLPGVAVALVAGLLGATLVLTRPWDGPDGPWRLGPASLLHVAAVAWLLGVDWLLRRNERRRLRRVGPASTA